MEYIESCIVKATEEIRNALDALHLEGIRFSVCSLGSRWLEAEFVVEFFRADQPCLLTAAQRDDVEEAIREVVSLVDHSWIDHKLDLVADFDPVRD